MNLPGLAPYARLIEEHAVRRFGVKEEATQPDTFAYEALIDGQSRRPESSFAERVANPFLVTVNRQGAASPRLRVRWSHWKTERGALATQ